MKSNWIKINLIIIIKLFIPNQTDDLIYYKCTM